MCHCFSHSPKATHWSISYQVSPFHLWLQLLSPDVNILFSGLFLDPLQCSFHFLHSTETAHINISARSKVSTLSSSSAAFNISDPSFLLEVFRILGFQYSVLRRSASYLTYFSFTVSNFFPFSIGLPPRTYSWPSSISCLHTISEWHCQIP